jgi:hypothetical protein
VTRTSAVLVLLGLVLLGVTGAGNRRARRELLAARGFLMHAAQAGG